MTKFLKQSCMWSRMQTDEQGEPVLDMYGEPSYDAPLQLRCRREKSLQDVLTATGAVSRSSTTYYLDEMHPISIGDLMDGRPIIDFEEYVNERGKTEGYVVVV